MVYRFSKVSRMSTVSVMVRVCVRITVSINVTVVQLALWVRVLELGLGFMV